MRRRDISGAFGEGCLSSAGGRVSPTAGSATVFDQRDSGGSEAEAGEGGGGAGANQPKISALKHYKLEGFSVERPMHFATALEHDVVIEIRPRAEAAKKGRILVIGAA
jgi:hypothetical protein